MSGFFSIGIEDAKFENNVGVLFRSAQAFGSNYIFTINKRYKGHKSDTGKSWRNVPLFHYKTVKEFVHSKPKDVKVIGVEVGVNGDSLKNFCHPKNAIYLLGAEDRGLSEEALECCDYVVEVPTLICLNVATTGSILMYDRLAKEK